MTGRRSDDVPTTAVERWMLDIRDKGAQLVENEGITPAEAADRVASLIQHEGHVPCVWCRYTQHVALARMIADKRVMDRRQPPSEGSADETDGNGVIVGAPPDGQSRPRSGRLQQRPHHSDTSVVWFWLERKMRYVPRVGDDGEKSVLDFTTEQLSDLVGYFEAHERTNARLKEIARRGVDECAEHGVERMRDLPSSVLASLERLAERALRGGA